MAAAMMRVDYIPLGGGLDTKSPPYQVKPGRLLACLNYEQKLTGGYRRVGGYSKFDTAAVPGEGRIRGVWRYNGKVYAFRNAVGGATCVMYESSGSGWTSKKTGLAPNGTYEFQSYNFATGLKMYGVSGTHKAFQWDGTTWTDITTGMATDTPSHLACHKKHLFLSFSGSLQFSPVGNPTGVWTVVTGAQEINIGDPITAIRPLPGGVLGIWSRNATNILSGSAASDWLVSALSEYGNQIGCIAGTLQQVGSRTIYLDDRGLTDLYTSQNFGDFQDATITDSVQSLIDSIKPDVPCSLAVRNKGQYRIFSENGYALSATFSKGRLLGVMRSKYPLTIRCACASEDSSGNEVLYFGSDDGYVYVMDDEDADDFDGTAVQASMRLAFTPFNAPSTKKRYRKVVLTTNARDNSNISVKPTYQFDDPDLPQALAQSVTVPASGSLFGTGIFGSSIFGATLEAEGHAYIDGVATNLSLVISSQAAPHEIDEVFVHYIPLGLRR